MRTLLGTKMVILTIFFAISSIFGSNAQQLVPLTAKPIVVNKPDTLVKKAQPNTPLSSDQLAEYATERAVRYSQRALRDADAARHSSEQALQDAQATDKARVDAEQDAQATDKARIEAEYNLQKAVQFKQEAEYNLQQIKARLKELDLLFAKYKSFITDTDGDGVCDAFDKEPNTPKGAMVETNGVAKDTDGDGVSDYKDREILTPQKCFPVNADGRGSCP